jgi:hypothetical protein
MTRFDPKNTNQLFHGTCCDIKGTPTPGGDGVFWTAETSSVAQNYIPAAGGSTRLRVDSYELDERVRPNQNDVAYAVAMMAGPPARDVKYDFRGHATSFIIPEGYATNRKIVEYLQNNMGYKNRLDSDTYFEFDIKTDGWDKEAKQLKVVHADHKLDGTLLIIKGFDDMKFYDMSNGDSDLTDLQYNKITTFRRLEEEGYDGVIIDDFAQSKYWGNMGHRSVGFFASACEKLRVNMIPARNFDWSDDTRNVTDTPEFTGWSRAKSAIEAVESSMEVLKKQTRKVNA